MRYFSFYIHHRDSPVPTVEFGAARDLEAARKVAQRALAESVNRTAVEIRENDRLLVSLERSAPAG